MKSNEQIGPSEYESMDTLALLRVYHKASVRLNSLREAAFRTHQKAEVASASTEWDNQIQVMKEARKVLETKGVKFTERGIDLPNSPKEIQDLVKNNGPE